MSVNEVYPNDGNNLAVFVADHVPAMLAYWDKDKICRFANDAYVDWFGKTKEEMINRIRIDELLGPLYEKNLPYIKAALAGEKQVFERSIPMPDGKSIRQSLATYTPDIVAGEVNGFFVHVAEVTYIKQLEDLVAKSKKEILQKTITAEEEERRYVVQTLRESVNQQIAACKMLVDRSRIANDENQSLDNVSLHLGEIMREINILCEELTPSEIEMFGITNALEDHVTRLSNDFKTQITTILQHDGIEKIKFQDKLAMYRIVQYLLTLILRSSQTKQIQLSLIYSSNALSISVKSNERLHLNRELKDYTSLISRIESYSGKLLETTVDGEFMIEVQFESTEAFFNADNLPGS